MTLHYSPNLDALIYSGYRPSVNFWNTLWLRGKLLKSVKDRSLDLLVLPETKKYIHRGGNILEGGCGIGQHVYRLRENGYNAVGVDSAARTIAAVKKIIPSLPIQTGDVRNLAFNDGYFDGYWSIGVIEHFFDGFDWVAGEMHRVIKNGGYLFVTFPHISLFRRMKITFHLYPIYKSNMKPRNFYQFALSDKKISTNFERLGFELVHSRQFDGYKGLVEALPIFQALFVNLEKFSKGHRIGKVIKLAISWSAIPIFSHSRLLVLRKKR